jgi:hypothetical protein
VDVPAVSLERDLLLNGVLFPADAGELANIHLTATGEDPLPLGVTTDQSYGPRWVVSGDYTPAYEFFFSSGQSPINPVAVAGPAVALTVDATLDIDVAAVDVSFDLTLGGHPFPANPGESAQILLRDVGSGVEFPIGTTDAGNPTVKIVSGTYDVVYSHVAGATVPQNQHAVVVRNLALLSDQTVPVDVSSWSQELTFTLNGVPFPPSVLADGEIFLRDFESGDSVSFGLTSDPSAVRLIIPGTYDASSWLNGPSSLVPGNSNAGLRRGSRRRPRGRDPGTRRARR